MVDRANGWVERDFGDERFLVKMDTGVQTLLGLGPPLAPGASLSRLRKVVANPEFPFETLACARQVHGSSIAVLDDVPRVDSVSSAGAHDGLISRVPGRGLVIWTADCVPILISGGSTVCALHAGWRGAATGLIPAAIEILRRRLKVLPSDLSVTIGPAIGACHYPVGSEVIAALSQSALSDSSWRQGNYVDLRVFVRQQLLDLGLARSRISVVGPCTSCDRCLASFRRDGSAAGRQISIIGLGRP